MIHFADSDFISALAGKLLITTYPIACMVTGFEHFGRINHPSGCSKHLTTQMVMEWNSKFIRGEWLMTISEMEVCGFRTRNWLLSVRTIHNKSRQRCCGCGQIRYSRLQGIIACKFVKQSGISAYNPFGEAHEAVLTRHSPTFVIGSLLLAFTSPVIGEACKIASSNQYCLPKKLIQTFPSLP